jgi:hypothetical protein
MRDERNVLRRDLGDSRPRWRLKLFQQHGLDEAARIGTPAREPTLGSSSYRKQTVPNCSGLSRQRIFNAFIQSAYFVGVELLVHLKKGPPERVSRDLLNCVADCLGRCGKSHIRYGSHRHRFLPAGEQLGSGAIVEKSHFTPQSACLAARQHIENLTGRGSPERKQRGCAYIRSNQLDFVVVFNDGALRHHS